MKDTLALKNRRLVVKLLLLIVVMFAVGAGLIPLYDTYTEASGVNSKLKLTLAEDIQQFKPDQTRSIRLDLLTSKGNGTPLKFEALSKQMAVHPGQVYEAMYQVTNLSHQSVRAHANPSVAPGLAANKIKLLACFCFETQQFAANETKQLLIRFAIDPELSASTHSIALAQQFFITQ